MGRVSRAKKKEKVIKVTAPKLSMSDKPTLGERAELLSKHMELKEKFHYLSPAEKKDADLMNMLEVGVVFVHPQWLVDLNVGYSAEKFEHMGFDLDSYAPFDILGIYYDIRDNTVGAGGYPIDFPVPGSDCSVNFVININGKYCRLNYGEWNLDNNYMNLELASQVKIFQRLLNEGQITFHDLEAAKINTDVYKRLVLNDEMGRDLFDDKVSQLKRWVNQQQNDPMLEKMYKAFRSS